MGKTEQWFFFEEYRFNSGAVSVPPDCVIPLIFGIQWRYEQSVVRKGIDDVGSESFQQVQFFLAFVQTIDRCNQ